MLRTQPRSTLAALEASSKLLRRGGVLAVTAYRGHDGGVEAKAVAGWMEGRRMEGWQVQRHASASRGPDPGPVLWLAGASADAAGRA